jgi:hypothetical protein
VSTQNSMWAFGGYRAARSVRSDCNMLLTQALNVRWFIFKRHPAAQLLRPSVILGLSYTHVRVGRCTGSRKFGHVHKVHRGWSRHSQRTARLRNTWTNDGKREGYAQHVAA